MHTYIRTWWGLAILQVASVSMFDFLGIKSLQLCSTTFLVTSTCLCYTCRLIHYKYMDSIQQYACTFISTGTWWSTCTYNFIACKHTSFHNIQSTCPFYTYRRICYCLYAYKLMDNTKLNFRDFLSVIQGTSTHSIGPVTAEGEADGVTLISVQINPCMHAWWSE